MHLSLSLCFSLLPPSLSLRHTCTHTHTHTHTHHSKSNDIIHRKDGGSTGLTYRGRIWTNESSRQFLMQWLILLPRFVFQCNWHCMVATDIEKIMHNNYALCTSGVHVIFCSVLHLNMSRQNMCTWCVCVCTGLPLTHRCASLMHNNPKWRTITTVNYLKWRTIYGVFNFFTTTQEHIPLKVK